MQSTFLPQSRPTPRKSAARRFARAPRQRSARVVAYHETEEIKDWRIKQMVTLCRTYFQKLWSKGDTAVAKEILDGDFVHQENIWRRKKLIVGPDAMAAWVEENRKAYPDLFVEPVDYGTGSVEHLFVQFEGRGTNLGPIHGKAPTRHNTTFTGVSTFRFNHDRSKITAVDVWRTPLSEDRIGGIDPTDLFEIHLNRLHFE